MLPEIREAIRGELKKLFIQKHFNWNSFVSDNIKETIKSPVSGRTFHRICKPNSEHTTTKKNLDKILKFLKISYTENYGLFQLLKTPKNETEN